MKKIVGKILIAVLLSCSAISAQWEIAGTMPRHVAGADAFVKDNNIYLFGGYSDSTQTVVNWIQKYQVLLDLWKQIGEMEYPRFSPVVEAFGDTAFIFGGVSITDFQKRSTISKWSLEPRSIILDTNDVFNRHLATGNIINGVYYLIGGNPNDKSSSDTSYITGYDLRTKEVVYRSSKIFPGLKPDQQMSAVIGNEIYIFGGVLNGILNTILRFDTITKELTTLRATLSIPRAGGRAIYDPNEKRIFIIGGYNESSNALKSVEIFKLLGNEPMISDLNELNFERTNFTAAFINDKIYVLGGYDQQGNPVKEIEIFATGLTSTGELILPAAELKQNYPNPFNPTTKIKFAVPSDVKNKMLNTKLIVYDILGREIASLVNKYLNPGGYEVEFNAEGFSSGVYYYKLEVGNFVETKKMILLR